MEKVGILALAFGVLMGGGVAAQEDSASGSEPPPEQANLQPPEPAASPPTAASTTPAWLERLSLGGYGEIHANFTEGAGGDKLDIHRLVLAFGYQFNDWISFQSELEVEHAFVSEGADGELVLEQATLDFGLNDTLNLRFGRLLTPTGVVNRKHEPPSFNGVERPSFAKYMIPTTWSSDGLGIFGRLLPSLRYELYLVNGLDGSKFDATNGIRKGRVKDTPSLHEPAVTGRLDLYPFAGFDPGLGQVLRLGLSGYYGGLDNGSGGKDPRVKGSIQIYAVDLEYSAWRFDLRGEVAYTRIEKAAQLQAGVASELFGFYTELAVHVLPQEWRRGFLAKADLTLFVRRDWFDTQYRVPGGASKDPRGRRREWTFGFTFHLLPNLAFKADYQLRSEGSLPSLFNFGIGWQL